MKRIAVIPGDGVGLEVVPAGVRVLEAVGSDLEFREFDWSCAYYDRHGRMCPADAFETLAGFDAIYLGAVGWPTVPDHVSLWGLLLPIRKAFQQYVNLRPVRLLAGLKTPLAGRDEHAIDMLFLRENTEGEYSGAGGRIHEGTELETAVEVPIFTAAAIERLARQGYEWARKRSRRLISVTKSNASRYGYTLWDDVVVRVGSEYPDVVVEKMLVDAMAARMVTSPQSVDVVIASNLFGDVLTDLGAAIQGGMGLAASANLDPSRRYPSLFEPVHGSAPDIAGKGLANPIGTIWAGAMLLDHLGQEAAGRRVLAAIETVCRAGAPLTRDLGGAASTAEVTDAILAAL
jgi:tartrate dehydrogenase/decarboxylase / D-malate dehydrogenase